MISPEQSEDLRLLAELRKDPTLWKLRRKLIQHQRKQRGTTPGVLPEYYPINKLLALVDNGYVGITKHSSGSSKRR
jgi:hypothetical protein